MRGRVRIRSVRRKLYCCGQVAQLLVATPRLTSAETEVMWPASSTAV